MICESDYGAALSSVVACWVYNSIILCVAVLELCLDHIVDSVYVGGPRSFLTVVVGIKVTFMNY